MSEKVDKVEQTLEAVSTLVQQMADAAKVKIFYTLYHAAT
jgi:hypothetical protein